MYIMNDGCAKCLFLSAMVIQICDVLVQKKNT